MSIAPVKDAPLEASTDSEERLTALQGVDPRENRPGELLTVITPPNGPGWIDVRELWRFRDLLYFLAWRDVKVRYKQTALGGAWALLQPALMMVVFTLFFQKVAGRNEASTLPYPLFAYCGLLPWTFFATAIASAGNSVIGSERIITKIYFPRLAIPFAAVGAAVVDFLVALSLLAGLLLWYQIPPGPNLWLAPVVFALILITALGVGTFLSALNVSYRDFRYVIPFLIQVWMFATPSIYLPNEANAGSTGLASLVLTLNPMAGLISTFRATIVGGPIPWANFIASALCGGIAFAAGSLYFRRVEDRFADII